jgi:hypothetical protein
MTTMTSPGQTRKTLAHQLDRLEIILDGLHQTLPAAIGKAVEQAVAAAVQQALSQALPALLTALLNQPPFLHTLHRETATAGLSIVPMRVAVRDACQRLGQASMAAWLQVRRACASWLGQVVPHSPLLAAAGQRLYRCKRRLLWSCGMGLATSLVIAWAGPWLGVTVGFLVGFLLTLAVPGRQ